MSSSSSTRLNAYKRRYLHKSVAKAFQIRSNVVDFRGKVASVDFFDEDDVRFLVVYTDGDQEHVDEETVLVLISRFDELRKNGVEGFAGPGDEGDEKKKGAKGKEGKEGKESGSANTKDTTKDNTKDNTNPAKKSKKSRKEDEFTRKQVEAFRKFGSKDAARKGKGAVGPGGYRVRDAVMVNYRGRNKWYKAVLKAPGNVPNTWDVTYDEDGEQGMDVELKHLQRDDSKGGEVTSIQEQKRGREKERLEDAAKQKDMFDVESSSEDEEEGDEDEEEEDAEAAAAAAAAAARKKQQLRKQKENDEKLRKAKEREEERERAVAKRKQREREELAADERAMKRQREEKEREEKERKKKKMVKELSNSKAAATALVALMGSAGATAGAESLSELQMSLKNAPFSRVPTGDSDSDEDSMDIFASARDVEEEEDDDDDDDDDVVGVEVKVIEPPSWVRAKGTELVIPQKRKAVGGVPGYDEAMMDGPLHSGGFSASTSTTTTMAIGIPAAMRLQQAQQRPTAEQERDNLKDAMDRFLDNVNSRAAEEWKKLGTMSDSQRSRAETGKWCAGDEHPKVAYDRLEKTRSLSKELAKFAHRKKYAYSGQGGVLGGVERKIEDVARCLKEVLQNWFFYAHGVLQLIPGVVVDKGRSDKMFLVFNDVGRGKEADFLRGVLKNTGRGGLAFGLIREDDAAQLAEEILSRIALTARELAATREKLSRVARPAFCDLSLNMRVALDVDKYGPDYVKVVFPGDGEGKYVGIYNSHFNLSYQTYEKVAGDVLMQSPLTRL
jgi:hypothetical protein